MDVSTNDKKSSTMTVPSTHRKDSNTSMISSIVRLKPKMNVFTGAAINIGVIIGSGIFISPKGVLEGAGSVGMTLIIWVLCGIVSILGALSYAELGTMIPEFGGEYAYIRFVYGDFPAFLALWIQLILIQPGSIAILTLTFGNYCLQPLFPDPACPPPQVAVQLLAILVIVFFCGVNAWSVDVSARIQDVFGVFKVVALGVIIIGGAVEMGKGNVDNFQNAFEGTNYRGLGVAFYSGLYSYAGWYTANILVEELKDPYRTLPRAIHLSMWTVIIIYVLTNVAYFTALTPAELLASNAVAVTFGDKVLGNFSWIVPTSVVLSVFGSVGANVLAVSRLFFVGARQGHFPDVLSMLNIRRSTPLPSLIVMTILCILYSFAKNVYTLINYCSFAAWTISGCATIGLVYLRWKRPDLPRPYKVNIVIPILFILACIFLVIMGTVSAPIDTLIGVAIASSAFPVYFIVVRPIWKFEWVNTTSDAVTVWLQKFLEVVKEEPISKPIDTKTKSLTESTPLQK
ncbi:Y+L amino acid transporter 2-like [Amphiura filiformis]|uniref:Y+L amino acid transporter 2-like n=1 Tax=Amphiura filiformis TaxID=82378 RepID=UPI003B22844C